MRTLFLLLLAGCEPVTPEPLSDCTSEGTDPYDLEDVALDGSDLVATLSYGGGCEEHELVLCWPDQSFAESDPVQVTLEIWHDANGDNCDAYLTDDHTFSLTPLEDAYVDAYGGSGGEMTLHVEGLTLEHSF